MIDIEYANAYSEVLEILKKISKEEYEKIPKQKIKTFEEFANKENEFKCNPKLTLDEQNVSKRAKAIIAILFRDYWATPYQREKILATQRFYREKNEEEKRDKYNSDNLFKSHNHELFNNNKQNSLVCAPKEKWYKKIIMRIRKKFNNL